jgi:hypothetical protein
MNLLISKLIKIYKTKRATPFDIALFISSVPKTGLEPAHLAAPPPEDGASTISPLGQHTSVAGRQGQK